MRIKYLDFLRGVAVLLVIFRHHDFVAVLEQAGWIGVDLFFVLSGFLVSSLLFNEFNSTQRIDGVRFLIRRGFKIYPGYYILIFSILAIQFVLARQLGGAVAQKYNYSFAEVMQELFFVQNYLGGFDMHTWSLAVEEHFYFFLTFSLYLIFRYASNVERAVTLYCVGVIVVCNILKIHAAFFDTPISYYRNIYPSHLRADSLIFGVLIAHYSINHKVAFLKFIRANKFILTTVALLFLLPPFFLTLKDKSDFVLLTGINFTMLYVGFGIILSLFLAFPSLEVGIKKLISEQVYGWVCTIGYYSYSIYLWHIPVHRYLSGLLVYVLKRDLPEPVTFVPYFVISIIVGIVFGKYVEIPFLKLRDRWFPKVNLKKVAVAPNTATGSA
jgi:peptidoglycan/LPS O-acetylase OafA/YrhL